MKISAATLKSIDYKQLLIDHGEKAVMLGVGLFMAVALLRTNWTRYERTPEEMTAKANEIATNIEQNEWPENERKAVEVTDDLQEKAQQVLSQIDVTRYEWQIPFEWSLYRKRQKYAEPEWLAIHELRGDYGRVLLAMTPEKTDQPTRAVAQPPDTTNANELDESNIPPHLRRSTTRITGQRSRNINSRLAGPGAGGGRLDEDEDEWERSQRLQRERPQRMGTRRGDDDDRGPGGIVTARTNTLATGRGYRFISVRGIYPLRDQLVKLQQSRHAESTREVENALVIRDFELHRQYAVPGPEIWSEWEPVDIQNARDVLNQVVDWDADIVDSGITDPVFTMPLPLRGFGQWWSEATHPGVQDFQLSAEEIERQLKLDKELIELHRKQQEKKESEPKLGGFAALQEDVRKIRFNFVRSNNREQDLKRIILAVDPTQDSNQIDERLRERYRQRATPTGRLLLFRYLDFAVEPGNTYRYRVRVKLDNPNHGIPAELALTPEVVERPERWTPWSEATEPIHVPSDAKHFLAKVDPSFDNSQSAALVDVFQWFPNTGTFVNSVIRTALGQIVGGKESAHVLHPIDEMFERETVDFSTNDVLVDMNSGPAIRREDHPDLQLTGRQPVGIGIPDRAVFADQYGELTVSDPLDDAGDYESARHVQELQDGQYEDIRDRLKTRADETGARLMLNGEEEAASGSRAYRQRLKEFRNARRRSGGGDEDD